MPPRGPLKIDFDAMDWAAVEGGGASGRTKRRVNGSGETVRLLEISPEWDEAEWCKKPHTGYVLSGQLNLDFHGRKPMRVDRGQAFSIPAGCAHKASCMRTTTLFLVG